ncbi:MAG: response regulator [Phycisphaerae bacterium]|nr:response regulator [Phycisphaerae bacterium]
MSTVLVVDDVAIFREPIAAALRREGYEAVCASNGEEALDRIYEGRPDLVLLDIGMPVMDGATCLQWIRGQPDLRNLRVVILTALSERETLKKVVETGVQGYLLKSQFSLDDMLVRVRKVLAEPVPCGASAAAARSAKRASPTVSPAAPPATVADAVATKAAAVPDEPAPLVEGSPPGFLERADVITEIQAHAQVRGVPTVLQHAIALTRSDRTSFDEVAAAVRQDQALAIKVIKVANSPLFGNGRGVKDLPEALHRIGMAGIRDAIATIATIDQFPFQARDGFTPQRFWEHSIASATLADAIGQLTDAPAREHLFLAGLLHDVGRIVLVTMFPEQYEWVLRVSARQNADLVVAEQEMFGLSHDEVTEMVLRQWNAPREIREAAALHQCDVEHIQHAACSPRGTLVVALANRLAHAMLLGDSGNAMLLPFDEHVKALSLRAADIHAIVVEAMQKAEDAQIFYASRSMGPTQGPLVSELSRLADRRMRVVVLAPGAPQDPLSLFCERIGWLDVARPQLALLSVTGERSLQARVKDLQKIESDRGTRLPVALVMPDETCVSIEEALPGRACEIIRMPGRYRDIIRRMTQACAEEAVQAVG